MTRGSYLREIPVKWKIIQIELPKIHINFWIAISSLNHRGSKGILLFLQSRGVVTLFHLFTIVIYGMNCFDMQH